MNPNSLFADHQNKLRASNASVRLTMLSAAEHIAISDAAVYRALCAAVAFDASDHAHVLAGKASER